MTWFVMSFTSGVLDRVSISTDPAGVAEVGLSRGLGLDEMKAQGGVTQVSDDAWSE